MSSARAVTRYFCGLTSPATTRAKLTRRPSFGRWAAVPFKTVLAQVEACNRAEFEARAIFLGPKPQQLAIPADAIHVLQPVLFMLVMIVLPIGCLIYGIATRARRTDVA